MPQILTNPSDIAYYQTQGDFVCVMLDEPPEQIAPKPKVKAKPEDDEPEDTDEEPEGETPEDTDGDEEPEGEDVTKPSLESAVIAADERKKTHGGKPIKPAKPVKTKGK